MKQSMYFIRLEIIIAVSLCGASSFRYRTYDQCGIIIAWFENGKRNISK